MAWVPKSSTKAKYNTKVEPHTGSCHARRFISICYIYKGLHSYPQCLMWHVGDGAKLRDRANFFKNSKPEYLLCNL